MLPDQIVSQGVTFDKRRPGMYISSTIAVGAPTNELRFSPNTSKKAISFSATRIIGVNVPVPGSAAPKVQNAVLTLSYQGPMTDVLTIADIAFIIDDFGTVLTPDVVKRLIQGAS